MMLHCQQENWQKIHPDLKQKNKFIQGDIQRPVTYAYIDHDLLSVESI